MFGTPKVFLLVLGLILFYHPAIADSESEINQGEHKTFTLPPASRDDLNNNLVVTSIVYEGNSAIKAEEITNHVAAFLNHSIQKIELEQLRQSVTQLYVQRGYVNSGAIIPENAFQNGVLRLKIVEGSILETRIEGMNSLNQRYLTSRLIRKGEPLNVTVLEERMRILLTDPLFDQINARLVPGSELGTAVLDLKVKRARNFGLSAEASNYQAPAVGSTFAGLNGWVRNLTTWGDLLDLSVRASEGSNHYDLGWEIPLFGSRTLLNLRVSRGSSSVIEEPLDSLNIDSDVNNEEIGVSHPSSTPPAENSRSAFLMLIAKTAPRWTVNRFLSLRVSRVAIRWCGIGDFSKTFYSALTST